VIRIDKFYNFFYSGTGVQTFLFLNSIFGTDGQVIELQQFKKAVCNFLKLYYAEMVKV
jgi:hypothetical protein